MVRERAQNRIRGAGNIHGNIGIPTEDRVIHLVWKADEIEALTDIDTLQV